MEVVLIVVAALALAFIAWTLVKKGKERRVEGRREQAVELRETARHHELEAERHQAEAAVQQHRATEVDPDGDRERMLER